jgi:hypothetical protein
MKKPETGKKSENQIGKDVNQNENIPQIEFCRLFLPKQNEIGRHNDDRPPQT